MTENMGVLILEYLRVLSSDLGLIKTDIYELKMRMSSLENCMASFHLEIARHSAKFDDVNARIDRLERRMELRDEA